MWGDVVWNINLWANKKFCNKKDEKVILKFSTQKKFSLSFKQIPTDILKILKQKKAVKEEGTNTIAQ